MLRFLRVQPLLALAGAIALMIATPALAQGPIDSETIKVDVPFNFVAGDTTLPAGTYQIEIGTGKTDPPVLAIQTHTTDDDEIVYRKVMALASQGDLAEDGPRLVFRKVGDLHFLEKVVPEEGKVKEVR